MNDEDRVLIERYQQVFTTDNGRAVLDDLKRRAGFYGSNVLKGRPIDKDRLVWHEAQRAFVLGIVNRVEWEFKAPVQKELNDGD